MSNLPARERDSNPLRPRLAAVERTVPSTGPDTSEVDGSWFSESPRHSFIAYTGTRYASTPLERGRDSAPAVATTAAPELAYDVYESPNALVVLVDLPGVEAEHVSLTLGSQAIYLQVSVPPAAEARRGVPAGDYEVRVEAPENVGPEAIDASLRHGVLRVRVSKSAGGARRVPIVSED